MNQELFNLKILKLQIAIYPNWLVSIGKENNSYYLHLGFLSIYWN